MNNEQIRKIILEEIENKNSNLDESIASKGAELVGKGVSKIFGKPVQKVGKLAPSTTKALEKIKGSKFLNFFKPDSAAYNFLSSTANRKAIADLARRGGGSRLLDDGSAILVTASKKIHHISADKVTKLELKSLSKQSLGLRSVLKIKDMPPQLKNELLNSKIISRISGGSSLSKPNILDALKGPFRKMVFKVKNKTGSVKNLTAMELSKLLLKWGTIGAAGLTILGSYYLLTPGDEAEEDEFLRNAGLGSLIDGNESGNEQDSMLSVPAVDKNESSHSLSIEDLTHPKVGSSSDRNDMTNKFIKLNLYDSKSDPSMGKIKYILIGDSKISKQKNDKEVALYTKVGNKWKVAFNGKNANLSSSLSSRFNDAIK